MPRQARKPCSGCGRRLGDAALQVVGNQLLEHAAEEAEHAHVGANPIRQLLRPGRLGIGEVRGAEHGHKNLRLADFTRRRIGDPDPFARVIHERLVPSDMVLAHHRRQPSFEPAKQIAESTVAVASWMGLPVFLPENHHGDRRGVSARAPIAPNLARRAVSGPALLRSGRTTGAPERNRWRHPATAIPTRPPPPVSSCPGSCCALPPEVVQSRARSPHRGEAATSFAFVACSVPASPASQVLTDHRWEGSAAVADLRGANRETKIVSGGQLHFGMAAGIKSESPTGLNRNSHIYSEIDMSRSSRSSEYRRAELAAKGGIKASLTVKAHTCCLCTRTVSTAATRARTRSRTDSWLSSGTQTGVNSPARCNFASAIASRLFVLMRSPGFRGIK